MDKDVFKIAGREFHSRLIVGTGKYRSFQEMARAHEASGAEIVTVAVRRVNLSDRRKWDCRIGSNWRSLATPRPFSRIISNWSGLPRRWRTRVLWSCPTRMTTWSPHAALLTPALPQSCRSVRQSAPGLAFKTRLIYGFCGK